LQTSYALKDIAPRLVVGAVAANVSLSLAGMAIRFANALAGAVLGERVDTAEVAASLRTLIARDDDEASVFLALVALVAVVLAVVVTATYVARVAIVLVLVAGAPLALVWHCLPQTEGAALLWWRAFAACLATQLGQSLAVVAAARVFSPAAGGPHSACPQPGGWSIWW
jgi:xanthine/uracil permease